MNARNALVLASLFWLAAAGVAAHGPEKASAVAPSPPVAPAPPAPQTPPAPPPQANPNRVAQDQTLSLVDAYYRYAVAAPGERGQRLSELLALARARSDTLAALVEDDAAEVLRVALPATLRANFPAQALPLLEQDADETGELEVLHVDYPNPVLNEYRYSLDTPRGRLALHFAANAPDLLTGTKVRVRGLRIGNAIALDGADLVVTKASVLPNTLGAQKTLTILVNFTDLATQPYTVAYAQSVMYTTTSNFDYEASYQQTWLVGDVAGWFTISESTTACNYTAIATKAKQAATAAGFNLANYSRYVYVFPANACSWWGLGSVGGNPSQAWIHSKWGFTLPVIGHEMGHNFGLYHSHSLDCGSVEVAATGCSVSEYGDIFDMMGSTNNTPHFNAFQKERLGWLNAGVSPPLITVPAVQGPTTYTIAPTELARDAVPRALKIPRVTSCGSTQEWLYVESRQARGFDAFLASNANVLAGVLVHKVTEGNADSSYLLDMTPATTSWSDPALVTGRTFIDPAVGLTITPLSVGSTASAISVGFPATTCTHAAPTVTATPTGTVWTSAGASVSYAVTVTNKDGCGCAPSTFDLSGVVPADWAASANRTGSIAPGASGSASMLVTSAATASPAFYPVTLKAANSVAPTVTGAVPATVAIATALTVTAATDKATYTLPSRRNQSVYATITTRLTSNSVGVSGGSVSVDVRDPRGSVQTFAGTSDANGNVVASYGMKSRVSPTGTYTVTSRGTVGQMTGTATATFVLQ